MQPMRSCGKWWSGSLVILPCRQEKRRRIVCSKRLRRLLRRGPRAPAGGSAVPGLPGTNGALTRWKARPSSCRSRRDHWDESRLCLRRRTGTAVVGKAAPQFGGLILCALSSAASITSARVPAWASIHSTSQAGRRTGTLTRRRCGSAGGRPPLRWAGVLAVMRHRTAWASESDAATNCRHLLQRLLR